MKNFKKFKTPLWLREIIQKISSDYDHRTPGLINFPLERAIDIRRPYYYWGFAKEYSGNSDVFIFERSVLSTRESSLLNSFCQEYELNIEYTKCPEIEVYQRVFIWPKL